ncbi:hypothetical protein FOCC_FOCC014031 [Frankliniella occidentalis]|nr:hypothetical protein FOCC_FOCC014031 [Frankliniella occidentalis]
MRYMFHSSQQEFTAVGEDISIPGHFWTRHPVIGVCYQLSFAAYRSIRERPTAPTTQIIWCKVIWNTLDALAAIVSGNTFNISRYEHTSLTLQCTSCTVYLAI